MVNSFFATGVHKYQIHPIVNWLKYGPFLTEVNMQKLNKINQSREQYLSFLHALIFKNQYLSFLHALIFYCLNYFFI